MSVLFLGTDVDYSGRQRVDNSFAGRSDTTILVRLDPAGQKCSVLHIPRDTIVMIPGHGADKINSANVLGGTALAETAVSQLLSQPIDRYVVLNLEGLVALVNELGGVTINIPKRMHYMDWTGKLKIDLQPGVHTLTGNQAMGFLRFRHDQLGDIGRVQRQQLFLRAVARKLADPRNWYHLPALLQIAQRSIKTDMSSVELLAAINFLHNLPKDRIQFAMLPGRFSRDGNWTVNQRKSRNFVAKFWGPPSEFANVADMNSSIDPHSISIAVKNFSSDPSAGIAVRRLLRQQGYNAVVRSVERNAQPRSTTEIIAEQGNPAAAYRVQSILNNAGQVAVASIGDIDADLTILLGNDVLPTLHYGAEDQQSAPASTKAIVDNAEHAGIAD